MCRARVPNGAASLSQTQGRPTALSGGRALLRPPASPVASLGSTIAIRAPNQYELQLVFCGSATTCRRHWPPRHTAAWHWLAPTPTPPRRAAATRGAYVARELEPVWCTLSEISALLTVTMPSSSRSSSQVDSAGTARVRRRAARQRGSNSQRAQNGPCSGLSILPRFSESASGVFSTAAAANQQRIRHGGGKACASRNSG